MDWDEPVVLRILATINKRLGGRKRGKKEPSGLRYPYVCDSSRMYCIRAEPRIQTARILDAITCWSKPELVDFATHQQFQRLKTTVPTVTRESSRRSLPVSTEVPSNPRIALEVFLSLHSRQREQDHSVSEDYARGIQTFNHLFAQYGHQELADGLPEPPQESTNIETTELNATASGNSQLLPPVMNPSGNTETRMEYVQEGSSITVLPSEVQMTDDNFTLSDATTPAHHEPDTGISQMDAADIETGLNNLLTIDDPGPSPFMVADPATTNQEPVATTSTRD